MWQPENLVLDSIRLHDRKPRTLSPYAATSLVRGRPLRGRSRELGMCGQCHAGSLVRTGSPIKTIRFLLFISQLAVPTDFVVSKIIGLSYSNKKSVVFTIFLTFFFSP